MKKLPQTQNKHSTKLVTILEISIPTIVVDKKAFCNISLVFNTRFDFKRTKMTMYKF